MKEPLVDTFSETCASTSRKYVVEQGILVPILSVFSVALFRFRFRKIALKLLLFWIFFISKKDSFMATFSKTCALYSRKYGLERDMSIKHLLGKLQFFW